MKRFWILVSILWLATCGGGGSPTEPEAPLAYNLSLTTNEDTALTFTFNEVTSSSTITVSSNTKNGTLSISGLTAIYTPNENFYGTDTFAYFVVKNGLNSTTANAEITVLPVNDAPTAYDKNGINVYNNQTAEIILDADDLDGDNLNFEIVDNPKNGSIYINGDTAVLSAQTIGNDSFTFRANDSLANSNIATISYEVLKPRVVFGEGYKVKGINLNNGNYEVIGTKDGSILRVTIDSNGDIIETNNFSSAFTNHYRSYLKTEDDGYLFQQDEPRTIEKFDENGNSVWSQQPSKSGSRNIARFINDYYAFDAQLYSKDGPLNKGFVFVCPQGGSSCVPSPFHLSDNSENINISDGQNLYVLGYRNNYIQAAKLENFREVDGDLRGDIVWGVTLINPNTDLPTNSKINFIQLSNQDFLASAKIEDSFQYNFWKINSDGNIEWIKHFYADDYENSTIDIKNTADDGIIIVGRVQVSEPTDTFTSLLRVIKTDSDLNVEWSKAFSDISSYYESYYVIQNSNEEYIITLNFIDLDNKTKILVIKTDSNGNQIF